MNYRELVLRTPGLHFYSIPALLVGLSSLFGGRELESRTRHLKLLSKPIWTSQAV